MTWLRLLIIGGVALFFVCGLASGKDAPYLGNLEVKIRCHPPLLYRDDVLVVELESSHDNFDFHRGTSGREAGEPAWKMKPSKDFPNFLPEVK